MPAAGDAASEMGPVIDPSLDCSSLKGLAWVGNRVIARQGIANCLYLTCGVACVTDSPNPSSISDSFKSGRVAMVLLKSQLEAFT